MRLDPLLPYIKKDWLVWECAGGEGYLANAIKDNGFQVIESDILTGQDFFEYQPAFDAIITNPPFSQKYKWLERCYELGKPFALLLPLETLTPAQELFRYYGMQLLVLSKRINFKMPNKGWEGSAQFPVGWFTWKMDLESDIVYGQIERQKGHYD